MTNQTPQQLLIGMIFTNADLRYAGRLDDKQGGDTIVTMERVGEAIALNAELANESTWLWLTSAQMGFPLRPTGGGEHEERAEDLDSSQGVRGHLVAYHLAPAITDFISDENRVCCNNDLEQTLTLLHSEWSKEIEPSGQSSTHHPLVVSKEGLTTCLDPGRGWTMTSGGWNFLKKQECWKGHEQALITTIKERQRCLPLLSFSRRDEEIYSSWGKKKDQR